MRTRPNKKK